MCTQLCRESNLLRFGIQDPLYGGGGRYLTRPAMTVPHHVPTRTFRPPNSESQGFPSIYLFVIDTTDGKMTTMLRSRLCLRDAAKRVSTLSSHHLGVRGPPLARMRAPVHQLQQHAYYSSDNSPPRSKASTEFSKNIDVDELEKKLKDLTGDHATWDHEKLKKLVYSKGF